MGIKRSFKADFKNHFEIHFPLRTSYVSIRQTTTSTLSIEISDFPKRKKTFSEPSQRARHAVINFPENQARSGALKKEGKIRGEKPPLLEVFHSFLPPSAIFHRHVRSKTPRIHGSRTSPITRAP